MNKKVVVHICLNIHQKMLPKVPLYNLWNDFACNQHLCDCFIKSYTLCNDFATLLMLKIHHFGDARYYFGTSGAQKWVKN